MQSPTMIKTAIIGGLVFAVVYTSSQYLSGRGFSPYGLVGGVAWAVAYLAVGHFKRKS